MDNETSLILSNNLKLFLLTITVGGIQIMLASLLGALGEVVFTINVQLIA
jgi:MATE family multidrug resistance protein